MAQTVIDEDHVVDKLFTKVKKDTGINAAHYPDFKDNFFHQADLLYLPDDSGYIYALVVVDAGSRKVDATPLKDKTPKAVIAGFKKIYKNGILQLT